MRPAKFQARDRKNTRIVRRCPIQLSHGLIFSYMPDRIRGVRNGDDVVMRIEENSRRCHQNTEENPVVRIIVMAAWWPVRRVNNFWKTRRRSPSEGQKTPRNNVEALEGERKTPGRTSDQRSTKNDGSDWHHCQIARGSPISVCAWRLTNLVLCRCGVLFIPLQEECVLFVLDR